MLPSLSWNQLSTDGNLQRYLLLREQIGAPNTRCQHIHEDSETPEDFQFSEQFLQIFWNEQHLHGTLRSVGGRSLEVVSPGTWNVGPGPDFRNAALRLNGELRTGDIEVHRAAQDWYHHGHDRDPAYARVILHVVWEKPAADVPADVPCFHLEPHLSRPWRELIQELQLQAYPYARRVGPGACALRLAATDNVLLVRLLRAAGTARFYEKAEAIYRNSVVKGFGQAVYEEVFAALGYRANQEPLRRLAQTVPLAELREMPDAPTRQAALLGTAGLLPDPSRDSVSRRGHPRVRRLWDAWWRLGRTQEALSWARSALRPFNRPERRIAAGLVWLEQCQYRPELRLLALAREAASPASLLRMLEREFVLSSDWDGEVGFARGLPKPARVLGRSRAADILVNVVLPFLHSFARHREEADLAERTMQAFLLCRPLQTNRRLTEVTHRLFVPPSRVREAVHRAVEQQGLLEIHRDFCQALQGECARCPLQAPDPDRYPAMTATGSAAGDAPRLPA